LCSVSKGDINCREAWPLPEIPSLNRIGKTRFRCSNRNLLTALRVRLRGEDGLCLLIVEKRILLLRRRRISKKSERRSIDYRNLLRPSKFSRRTFCRMAVFSASRSEERDRYLYYCKISKITFQ